MKHQIFEIILKKKKLFVKMTTKHIHIYVNMKNMFCFSFVGFTFLMRHVSTSRMRAPNAIRWQGEIADDWRWLPNFCAMNRRKTQWELGCKQMLMTMLLHKNSKQADPFKIPKSKFHWPYIHISIYLNIFLQMIIFILFLNLYFLIEKLADVHL